ncbi:hypothetical protein LAUMK191_05572 [Mycobacterium attenuatum]|nr:hypothetical protein LAUMK191_05572 [Mycobacterium attenuatum]
MIREIAALDVDDGVVFDLDTIGVREIREQAHYPALRLRITVSIGPWRGTAAWDVSTVDPIVPSPRQVTIDRILSQPITLLGYAPETAIAEKGVTILERGISSTRWRDYVDIVQLARQGLEADELLRSARAVARTAASPSDPSQRISSVTVKSHERNGTRGAVRSISNPSAKKPSATRSPWLRLSSIPSLLTVLNRSRRPQSNG